MKLVVQTWLVLVLLHSGFAVGEQPIPQGEALETEARQFVDLLASGEFDKATAGFDATMSKAMAADKLRSTWQGLQSQAGNFKSHGAVSKQSVSGYEIVLLTCKFQRMLLNTKVVFDKQKKIAGLFFLPVSKRRTPLYANRDAFTETEVTVGSEPWKLPGTLTVPKGVGPFPAVVLVHGSGPNDRDESIGPNKVFKDLAWGLATKDIAVLRYDKRTMVHQAAVASLSELTVVKETIDDALAAVVLLAQNRSVDAKRIFVAGHSLGGYLIPRIAAADQTGLIAGYVSLAGSTRPTEDLILEQTQYILGLDGSLSESDKEQISQLTEQVDAVKALTGDRGDTTTLGAPPSYWIDLRGYSPPESAKAIQQPLLVLQGERDYQVTMQDYSNWQRALANRANVTFKSYPRLNHLFIEGTGRSTPAEYQVAGNVAPQVIEDLAKWIEGR